MDWLPSDSNFLVIFGAVFAAGTAMLGLIVGLSQLSGAARARRTVEWTSSALESESNTARRTVLERLKLRGQGYLVAANYVPWWRFTEAVVWALLAPTSAILVASRNGDVSALISAFTLSTVLLAIIGRRTIRLYSERMRVSYLFAEGGVDVEPVKTDILAQMEGGTRREFTLGFACAILVMGTAGLFAWAILEGSRGILWAGPSSGPLPVGTVFRSSMHTRDVGRSRC